MYIRSEISMPVTVRMARNTASAHDEGNVTHSGPEGHVADSGDSENGLRDHGASEKAGQHARQRGDQRIMVFRKACLGYRMLDNPWPRRSM